MKIKEILLKRYWIYTPIAWLWLFIACVIAFNAHNIPIIMNNLLISLILYMVVTYVIVELTEKCAIKK